MAQELGGKRLVGEMGGMFAQVRQAVEAAKLGIAGAVSECITEVDGLKQVEKAIREETAAIRNFKADMLGNALGGENQEERPAPEQSGER